MHCLWVYVLFCCYRLTISNINAHIFIKQNIKSIGFSPVRVFILSFIMKLQKNNLPIKYIFDPQNDALECGWFVFDKTLLIPDTVIEYHSDVGKWFCSEYDGGHEAVSVPLDEYLRQEIERANECLGSEVCNKAVILADVNNIENIDIAKLEKSFLIYDNNREEVIKTFCKNL